MCLGFNKYVFLDFQLFAFNCSNVALYDGNRGRVPMVNCRYPRHPCPALRGNCKQM